MNEMKNAVENREHGQYEETWERIFGDESYKGPEYVSIRDGKGHLWEIMEWITRMATEYGWKSGIADMDMARAIEKGREDPEDPWALHQSLAKSRFTYEALRFCEGIRDPELIHAGSAYEGEEILTVVAPSRSKTHGIPGG